MMWQTDVHCIDIAFGQQRCAISKDGSASSLLCPLLCMLGNHVTHGGDARILNFEISVEVWSRNATTTNKSNLDRHANLLVVSPDTIICSDLLPLSQHQTASSVSFTAVFFCAERFAASINIVNSRAIWMFSSAVVSSWICVIHCWKAIGLSGGMLLVRSFH